jgi:hypothetical protein
MKDYSNIRNQFDLARRDVLKGAVAAMAVGALGGVGTITKANAAENSVRAYGVTTAQLKDWSIMKNSIGVDMEFVGTDNSVGVFLRDVVASRLGDEVDLFVFESGTEDILGPQGIYLEIDQNHPELTLWERTSDDWKHSAVVTSKDGRQYGVPMIGNADSFGYFPEKIGASPDGQEDISWAMFFESDTTRGRVAYDQTWTYSLPVCALFLKHHGRVDIDDVVDMKKEEVSQVVDYLIERKKAGQFRTLHSAFEEQIQLLVNREVDIINCWEPATKEANLALGPGTVFYAYTDEGYFKWGHGAYIASQAADRGNLDNIYKVLNYFLGGEYRALQARDRGYAGPNLDLGVKYAEDQGWPQEDIDNLTANQAKIERKFAKPFVSTTTPENSDVMEEEWQRFLNA